MNGNDTAEVRSMIRDEIGRLWKKVDRLESKVGKLSVRLVQVSMVTGGIVTVGNIVAAIVLNKIFGFFTGTGP